MLSKLLCLAALWNWVQITACSRAKLLVADYVNCMHSARAVASHRAAVSREYRQYRGENWKATTLYIYDLSSSLQNTWRSYTCTKLPWQRMLVEITTQQWSSLHVEFWFALPCTFIIKWKKKHSRCKTLCAFRCIRKAYSWKPWILIEMRNYIFLKNHVTSEGAVSHKFVYYQKLSIAR